ncbi:dTDP-4-dehydrorhamnose 3,5-epimerase [Aurantiacibacter sediminis]|uniref:dTDP-4-dehydrorhamnose 3,5-epimerase n=1 Tax=Aurantiacibacter sediminis TaxID=2793064 RepID=A0ABS0MZV3_9SPHN|nr:dTDP-4-dehydrorhamnose 3,5-epimerase [Aurantiacibacter sediminis]MBH5321244.1 dTDP-4-dehydrorhamnose 3,5-epimerase [Aurantiacibacter sediminis]
MKVSPCAVEGPLLIEPRIIEDDRGFFMESWNAAAFAKAGINAKFVQDNHSHSDRGVLRGLHFQNPQPQGKLVRVVTGSVFDVAVDLRRSSPTFGQWVGIELSASNRRMLWLPRGFAHGFLTLEDGTDFVYKCDAFYASEHEHTLAWNDPDIGIDWPISADKIRLSAKDREGAAFREVEAFA